MRSSAQNNPSAPAAVFRRHFVIAIVDSREKHRKFVTNERAPSTPICVPARCFTRVYRCVYVCGRFVTGDCCFCCCCCCYANLFQRYAGILLSHRSVLPGEVLSSGFVSESAIDRSLFASCVLRSEPNTSTSLTSSRELKATTHRVPKGTRTINHPLTIFRHRAELHLTEMVSNPAFTRTACESKPQWRRSNDG